MCIDRFSSADIYNATIFQTNPQLCLTINFEAAYHSMNSQQHEFTRANPMNNVICYMCLLDVDYSLPAQSLSVTFSSVDGEEFCIDISAIEDAIGEGTEQFELYFENLPSASALAGDPDVLCVNILDNDGELISVLLLGG